MNWLNTIEEIMQNKSKYLECSVSWLNISVWEFILDIGIYI